MQINMDEPKTGVKSSRHNPMLRYFLIRRQSMRMNLPNIGFSVLIAVSIASPAANALDLNGAWANDLAVCNKIFEKKDNTISITRDSDQYGSGFIISGNQIRGKIATCTVKSRKEDGAMLNLIANCSTDVALSTVQMSLKIDSEN